MNIFQKLLNPSPHAKPIEDQQKINSSYRYWRIRILYASFIGYAVYYFTRGTFAIAMPELKKLGFDEVSLGWIATIFQISYGISKFTSGILADRSNPRYFMAFGLCITGIINIFFGLSSSLLLFALLWGLNGWFQGWGSAPCHRLLTHWYAKAERGRWWSIWNTSHNVGAAVLPLVAAVLVRHFGWGSALIVPGAIAIGVSFLLINRLRDTPQSLGLPRIEKHSHEPDAEQLDDDEKELSTREILVTYVLKNRLIWMLAVAYFLVYVIRWAVATWTYHYLVDAKQFSKIMAASCLFWFEFGGFFGGLAAGWLSDLMFNGRRGPVNLLFMALLLPTLFLFWHTATSDMGIVAMQFCIGLLGFLIFGPQMLINVTAAELSHKKATATAIGFLGIIAYIGCSVTGGPFGHLIRDSGWDSFFLILIGCAIAGTLMLIPLRSARAPETPVPSKRATAN